MKKIAQFLFSSAAFSGLAQAIEMTGKVAYNSQDQPIHVHYLTVGSDTQMQVILDTTFSGMALASSDCKDCWHDPDSVTAHRYENYYRLLSGEASEADEYSDLAYGNAVLNGTQARDRFCLSDLQLNCVDQQEMFLVAENTRSIFDEPVNGIMGLARYGQSYYAANQVATPSESQSPVKSLVMAKSFLLHQSSDNQEYAADFGYEDDFDDGTKISVIDDFFWSSWTQGVQFGDEKTRRFGFTYTDQVLWNQAQDGMYTIFDSVSQDIIIPQLYWSDFLSNVNKYEQFKNFVPARMYDGRIYLNCSDSSFEHANIYFQVDGVMLKVRPSDYMTSVTHADDELYCMTRFVVSNAPFLVLGKPVYRDYRVVHRMAVLGESYMSFMQGDEHISDEDDIKGIPEVDTEIAEFKLNIQNLGGSSTALTDDIELEAYVQSVMIGSSIGAGTAYLLTTEFLIMRKVNEDGTKTFRPWYFVTGLIMYGWIAAFTLYLIDLLNPQIFEKLNVPTTQHQAMSATEALELFYSIGL